MITFKDLLVISIRPKTVYSFWASAAFCILQEYYFHNFWRCLGKSNFGILPGGACRIPAWDVLNAGQNSSVSLLYGGNLHDWLSRLCDFMRRVLV